MAQDFRDAKSYKEKPEKRTKAGAVKARWWEVEKDERAQYVIDTGTSLKDASGNRMATMIRHARLYENAQIDSLGGRDYSDALARQILLSGSLMSLNVAAACVDTLVAKITKNRPRPMFLTSGGSWEAQIKARNLDKWSKGFCYETRVYEKSPQVFLDGCEFGTGFLHVYPEKNGKLCCERVIPSEIFVDDLDGQYGEPRQMLRLKYISKDVLIRLFPKKEQEILDAGKADRLDVVSADTEVLDNTVEVWEAWHLPSGDGAKDGKHVIAIDGCTLVDEEWKIQRFPFVEHRFKRRTTGFWGKGVVETVEGIQIELNDTVKSIAKQIRRKGKGRTYVQIGSKVVASHLTNEDGGDLVYYTGATPQVDNANAIAPEEFAYVDRLYQKAFQECGISELSASAKKPAGLDAAVALREYSDIESERFAPQHQAWEKFYMDFIDLSIDLITKQYGWKAYKVLVPGRRDLLEVDWAKVDMERDAYVMQVFPVSSLPQTPSARYQKVREMLQDGFITKPVAQRLLEFPDIEAESNLGNAMMDDVDATISRILDDENPEPQPVEPYQNIDLLIERANAAYLYARNRNCPEERLRLLRALIDEATATKARLMAPPAPPMGAPGAMPPDMGAGASPMPPMVGGPQITNTLNVPPPVIPAAPPVVGQ